MACKKKLSLHKIDKEMAKFKTININNFRGINKLSLENLSNVNIILGKNNFGKTSILESFFLLSGMTNSLLPGRINLFRDPSQAGNPLGQIKYLFHNIQVKTSPSFSCVMDDDEHRELNISLSDSTTIQGPIVRNGLISGSEQKVNALCISLGGEYWKGKNKHEKFKCQFCTYENGQFSQDTVKNYHESILARYISPDPNAFSLSEELSSLIKANKKEEVLNLTKLFDNRITNIEVLMDSVYIAFNGITDLLPICMCGDGLKKFLHIISCVADGNNKILLIDEIDNGIHFSAYSLLWGSIIRLAKQNGTQLVITTHSLEVLSELAKVIDDDNFEDVCAYTITKNDNNIMNSYRYNGKNIVTAINNQLEIRD